MGRYVSIIHGTRHSSGNEIEGVAADNFLVAGSCGKSSSNDEEKHQLSYRILTLLAHGGLHQEAQ